MRKLVWPYRLPSLDHWHRNCSLLLAKTWLERKYVEREAFEEEHFIRLPVSYAVLNGSLVWHKS